MDIPAAAVTSTGTRLVLWRHGESQWNRERRCQGQGDPPLTTRGTAQARAAARPLANLGPTAIVSSDLQRAYDTARALAGMTGLSVSVDKRWRETGKGNWEGLTHTEIDERFPDQAKAWRQGEDISPGDGERRAEVTARALAAATDAVAGQPPGAMVIASTHQGLIRHLVAALLEIPDLRLLGGVDNAASTILEYQPHAGWRLIAHNTYLGAAGKLENLR